MEENIFDNFNDGVDFCIKNHNNEVCQLQFVNELLDDPSKEARVEFLAIDGATEDVLDAIGQHLFDCRCKLFKKEADEIMTMNVL